MDRKLPRTDSAKTAADLRSQLQQMASASQVLERTLESEKGRTYLSMMNQSICRMFRIVGRMELGHRLSGNEITPSLKQLDLSVHLNSLGARIRSVLADIGITLTLNCPEYLPVCVDLELLQQLLLELVSNLALVGTDITMTVTRSGEVIYLTLSDTGPGKAEGRTTLPTILEDQEEKSSLELARHLAEVLGGSLVISSDADQALSAAVSIPAGKVVSDALKSPRSSWQPGGFDPVLVALSSLLPARSFLPENLG